jgi:hypothetical protein
MSPEKPPEREKVLFEKLKPPGRHRKQPKGGAEQAFEATQARNERRSLAEKYQRKYKGRHRKDQ